MTNRSLNMPGKGQADYDYQHDILFFKVKNRTYDHSIELDDIVVDFDTEGYPVGIQFFDASQLFQIDKLVLKGLQEWKFRLTIEDGTLRILLAFTTVRRNKKRVEQRQNIMREIRDHNIKNTEVVCTITEKK